jgi:hypothetical protein
MANRINNPAFAAWSSGALAFTIKGAPGGSRVAVSVTAGIQWNKKVAE